MAGGGITAVPAPKGLELQFVDKNGNTIEEARYGLFDDAFGGGTELMDGPGERSYVSKDARSFRLRVKTPLGAGRKQLKATWRTLWPMKADELAEVDAGGPLDGKMIHQSELTLTLTKEKGVYLSEPVMLVAARCDLAPCCVGWKDADAVEGQPDYRLLLAHVQGRVQLEHSWGKGKVARRSIPVWKKVRTLWIQNLVCEVRTDEPKDPENVFDPRSGPDKEYFCIAMRQMQQILAAQGVYANTWQPGADVHTVEDGGTAYSFRFVAVPPSEVKAIPKDPEFFQKAPEHQAYVDPLNLNVWDRMVRYPRAYPPWSPNVIRVFFGRQPSDAGAHGIAVADDVDYTKKDLAKRACLLPAARSAFVFHAKGLNSALDDDCSMVQGRKYGGGPQTLCHEVGHILMPKRVVVVTTEVHAHEDAFTHLMVAGATTGALAREVSVRSTRRIYDESDYAWTRELQNFAGLEG